MHSLTSVSLSVLLMLSGGLLVEICGEAYTGNLSKSAKQMLIFEGENGFNTFRLKKMLPTFISSYFLHFFLYPLKKFASCFQSKLCADGLLVR